MKVRKYEELDAGILSMLNKSPTPVFNIWLKFQSDVKDIFIIDRRMQSLKNKGLVANIRGKGWVRL